jgi:chromosome segregation ATPase
MNMQSFRQETRVSAQEAMLLFVNAQIAELTEDINNVFEMMIKGQKQNESKIDALSQDMTASFKQQAHDHFQTERQIDERFNKVEEDVAGVKADLGAVKKDVAAMKATMATKADLDAVKEDVAAMKATMATKADLDAVKEDVAAMKATMATKEDIATIKEDIATVKGDIATIKGDMTAMEGRMLDAFKQLLTVIDARLPLAQYIPSSPL